MQMKKRKKKRKNVQTPTDDGSRDNDNDIVDFIKTTCAPNNVGTYITYTTFQIIVGTIFKSASII